MHKRFLSRDVAVQIVYQMQMQEDYDYQKLLHRYQDYCESGELVSIMRAGEEGNDEATVETEQGRLPHSEKRALPKEGDQLSLDEEYLDQLLEAIVSNREEIDRSIEQHLVNWKLSRIASIELAILRVSLAEILYLGLPFKTSVNEAVELAKKYSEEKSAKFINGILKNFVSQ